jgi:hypothetical protein
MTEMHNGGQATPKGKLTHRDSATPRVATVWIGYQNADRTKWYPFGSELAAWRWAGKGEKPSVEELELGKPKD